MKRLVLVKILVLALAACGPNQPCPTCGADDDPPPDMAEEIPDLPCGGADLQSDDLNCGTCGNECEMRGEGDYEAGGCTAGVCGPTWYGQEWWEPSPLTCDEVCATATFEMLSCQASGCIGLTGFVCERGDFGPCDTVTGGFPPLLDFSGACDDVIPWPEGGVGGYRDIYCCCG